VIYAVSAKDADRLKGGLKKDGTPAYLQPYHPGEPMAPFDLKSGHAYVTITPVVQFTVAGQDIISATDIRNMLSHNDAQLQRQVLQDLYGKNAAAAAKIVLPHFK
jgi:hypothetical protein